MTSSHSESPGALQPGSAGGETGGGPGVSADQEVAVLGLMSASKLAQFSALARVAIMAPDVASRFAMARRASVQIQRVSRLKDMLDGLGVDQMEAIARYISPFDAFDAALAPADWWEALVKGYVGQGVANDLETELIGGLGGDWPARLGPVRATGASREQVAQIVATTAASDQRWAARLSLWGRRVFGEALSAAQHLVFEDSQLAPIVARSSGSDVAQMRSAITTAHASRMAALGLTA